MSRTYSGYLFKCKVCGKTHLMDSGEPHRGIRLPCVDNKYAVEKYNKSDFEFWHGLYWDVDDILVQEVKKSILSMIFEKLIKMRWKYDD